MRPWLSRLVVLLLAFQCVTPAFSAAGPRCDAAQGSSTQKVATVAGQESPRVEVLRGPRASLYLEDLRRRRPAVFGEAIAELSQRGYRPTQTVFLVRTVIPISASDADPGRAGKAPGVVLAQRYTKYAQQGEIVFWSWDDGYDGTWEGTLYAENYSTGVSETHNAQINIEVAGNFWTVWQRLVSKERNGVPIRTRHPAPPPSGSFYGSVLASLNAQGNSHVDRAVRAERAAGGGSPMLAQENPPDQQDPFANYYECAFWGCLAAAGGCALMGPLAPECFVVTCTAVLINCLQYLF